MTLADAIKKIRHKCILSQQGFAEELGVSFSTVNRWERNKAVPNYQTMKRLVAYCNALNVDSEELESLWKEQRNIINQ